MHNALSEIDGMWQIGRDRSETWKGKNCGLVAEPMNNCGAREGTGDMTAILKSCKG